MRQNNCRLKEVLRFDWIPDGCSLINYDVRKRCTLTERVGNRIDTVP
jgi:hypothetical protein